MRSELLLKSNLLVDGVRIDDSALDGVGRRHKEQLHHLFEYDFDLHQTTAAPADLRLAGGSVVQVRLNERSRFLIRREDDRLVVEEGGLPVGEIQWVERPAFYGSSTANGTPATRIAEMVGEDCISVCHTNACLLFADGNPCAFCNMNFTPKQYDVVLIRKRAAEVGEVIASALRGGARHFLITGGILPGNREVDLLETYLTAIRDATGLDSLPGAVIMTPPEDLQELSRLRRLGLQGIGFNLECFHPAWFKAVCPGKEQRVGYEKYRAALRTAVEMFGAGGRVFSGFIAGIEPMQHLLAGVQELAEEGVASIPLVWSPSAGTLLHGHRPPGAEWYLELAEKAASLMVRHMKRDRSGPAPEPLRCLRCQNQSLMHDVLQSRMRLLKAAVS